jgi:hypothetical protein
MVLMYLECTLSPEPGHECWNLGLWSGCQTWLLLTVVRMTFLRPCCLLTPQGTQQPDITF